MAEGRAASSGAISGKCGLRSIRDLFGSPCAHFEVIDKRTSIPVLQKSFGVDPENIHDYATYYAGISPRVRDGLTPSECRVAQALLSGTPLTDYADGNGVSIRTVRTHLSNVLHKTGSRNQVDLVRLLSATAPTTI